MRVTTPVALNAGTDAIAKSDDGLVTGAYDYVGAASPNVPTGTVSSDAVIVAPTLPITSLGLFTVGTKGIPMTL